MTWFGWFRALRSDATEALERRENELCLSVAHLTLQEENLDARLKYLRQGIVRLQANTRGLEDLPTVKKLRATIKAMQAGRDRALERVQTAEKASEDAAYQEEMARHYSTRTK